MTDPKIEAEVTEIYEQYLAAFIRNDLHSANSFILYPLTYIGDGSVKMLETFPVDPAELKRAKQWHSTINAQLEVVATSPTKAHVVLRTADRVREDGSLIETVSAFYAFTRTKSGWKIFAISDVVNPA